MSSQDDPALSTTERPFQHSPYRSAGTMSIAVLVSLALHGLMVLGLTVASYLELPFAVRFTESSGIGMLSRVGVLLEGSQVQTAPRYLTVDMTPPPALLGPTAPSTTEQAAMVQAREEAIAAQIAEEEAAARVLAEAKREEDARAQARAERRERERQETRAAEARAAEERAAQERAEAANQATDGETVGREDGEEAGVGDQGQAGAGPDLQLPPGDRYPAGTINPIATDLGMWGPEGARLVVVARNDRLRNSPHAASVEGVLQSFPDWRTLVGGANLQPLRDIDTIVIASADPRYINQTFMAAVHSLPTERVIRTLSQGNHGGVSWENQGGRLIGRPTPLAGIDPRVFYVPTEKIFIFSRPEFMDALQRRAPTARGMDEAIELTQLSAEAFAAKLAEANDDERLRAVRPDDAPPLREAGWIRGLIDIADYGGTDKDGPAVMISTGRIDDMRIQGYRGVMPVGLHANIYADANVRITGRFIFNERAEAEAFQRAWPSIIEANRQALTVTGLYRPMADAKLSIDHNETIAELTIPEATIRRMGVTVSQMMQLR